MAEIKKLKDKGEKIYNPDALLITPYVAVPGGGIKIGPDSYLFEEVVRDSTSMNQDDPESNTIENEFSAEPLIDNINAGSYKFATNIGDMQGQVLAKLAGFTYDASKNLAYAPKGYVEVFAKIELIFKKGTDKKVAAVLPKVQLNSKALLESINTSLGQVAVAGTGYSGVVGIAGSNVEAPFYIDYEWEEAHAGDYVAS